MHFNIIKTLKTVNHALSNSAICILPWCLEAEICCITKTYCISINSNWLYIPFAMWLYLNLLLLMHALPSTALNDFLCFYCRLVIIRHFVLLLVCCMLLPWSINPSISVSYICFSYLFLNAFLFFRHQALTF